MRDHRTRRRSSGAFPPLHNVNQVLGDGYRQGEPMSKGGGCSKAPQQAQVNNAVWFVHNNEIGTSFR